MSDAPGFYECLAAAPAVRIVITTAMVHIAAGVSSRSRLPEVLLGVGRAPSVMTIDIAETDPDGAEPS
ncbi:hypothetical protein P3102_18990 [Amycolatopsis sp. QT-25]|uniref:hypothetical protein n=1 Tax=Amycolatopsis sp. QT-25 TaxID=3034022 RepID=UPI0023EB1CB7|nr:hypothetical protein [Amycolatopsis sp. QT-25]WET76225.1 hypothetical protein P3102_18990 [Amycolatopsis sp. QT-25]